MWMLLPYNILTAGATMYYTINFRRYNIFAQERFSKKLFKPKKFGIKEIIKYGTI